jgi:hypothetical protein
MSGFYIFLIVMIAGATIASVASSFATAWSKRKGYETKADRDLAAAELVRAKGEFPQAETPYPFTWSHGAEA